MPINVLSIREPWAYCILHCGKDIENRHYIFPHQLHSQRIYIHSSKTVDWDGYWNLIDCEIKLPTMEKIKSRCGFITGSVQLTGVIYQSGSPWFIEGSVGWKLKDPKELSTFISAKGRLGFWEYYFETEKKPTDNQLALNLT